MYKGQPTDWRSSYSRYWIYWMSDNFVWFEVPHSMTFHTKCIGYSDNLIKNSLSPALSLYPISPVYTYFRNYCCVANVLSVIYANLFKEKSGT